MRQIVQRGRIHGRGGRYFAHPRIHSLGHHFVRFGMFHLWRVHEEEATRRKVKAFDKFRKGVRPVLQEHGLHREHGGYNGQFAKIQEGTDANDDVADDAELPGHEDAKQLQHHVAGRGKGHGP